MKKLLKFPVLLLVASLVLGLAGCGDGDDGNGDNNGVTLPQSSGTNEVVGKTLYLREESKIDFAGTSFEGYREDWDEESYESMFVIDSKGTYSYNSENKTITLAVEQIYGDGKWLNKTQAKKAMEAEIDAEIAYIRQNSGQEEINKILAEMGFKNIAELKAVYLSELDEEFAPTTYDYYITSDGALLVQEKLPANKGSNELQGKTFTYNNWESYTFTTNVYTLDDYEFPETGTYAYDSVAKRVWLRPEKIGYDSQTITECYDELSYYGYYSTAEDRAAETNSRFRAKRNYSYSLNPNRIFQRFVNEAEPSSPVQK
jgi:uncharacterized lipoprotein YehR (DUF1307 family)